MCSALDQSIHRLDAYGRDLVLERLAKSLDCRLARRTDIAHSFHGPLANERIIILERGQQRRQRILRIVTETAEHAGGFCPLVGIGVLQEGNPLGDGFAEEERLLTCRCSCFGSAASQEEKAETEYDRRNSAHGSLWVGDPFHLARSRWPCISCLPSKIRI